MYDEGIKSYEPETKSIGSGQVLSCAYSCEKAKLVLKEMINELVLDLLKNGYDRSDCVNS